LNDVSGLAATESLIYFARRLEGAENLLKLFSGRKALNLLLKKRKSLHATKENITEEAGHRVTSRKKPI
jgi:hypothetical protein